MLLYHAILGYIPDGKGDRLVEVSILSPARLDACIETVEECFSERETRRGHREKRYADTTGWNMRVVVEQIFRHIRVFVER